jgi:hypothetical protein
MLDPVTPHRKSSAIRDGARWLVAKRHRSDRQSDGARRLRVALFPAARDPAAIRARQNAIEAFRQQPERLTRGLLRDMGDVDARRAAGLGVPRRAICRTWDGGTNTCRPGSRPRQ